METEKHDNVLSEDERQDMIVRERLRSYCEQIDDQLGHINEGLDFYTQHTNDFCPEGHLSEILMKLDIAGCGPLLVKLFPELELEGDLEKDITTLKQIEQSEIDDRWHTFLQQAYELTELIQANHLTDTASWILGQDTSPVPAHHDPEQPKQDWKFLHETPDIRNLVALMTVEKLTKRFSKEQNDAWLSADREPTEIDPSVDQRQVERLFGAVGPDALYALLPRELQGAIAKIKLIAPERSKIITAHGEEYQYEFHGKFDKDDATMQFVISPEQTIERILETWFHELGHAIITGSTSIDRDIRMQYAQAVARSGKLQDGYASGIYDTEGIERGLEEDFADSIRRFFIYRQEFAQDEPDRSEAINNIMQKYCAGFNHRDLTKKIYIFMKNTQTRKAA